MNRRVILRPQIPGDLETVLRYLERRSVAIADRFIHSVFEAFDDLAAMPGKGSPKGFRLPGLSGLRSWSVPGFPNHLIYYLTTDEAIIIFAVIHGAHDIPSVLRDRVP